LTFERMAVFYVARNLSLTNAQSTAVDGCLLVRSLGKPLGVS
jgi:hypothetical protein